MRFSRPSVRVLTTILLVPTLALGSLLISSCAYAQRIKPSFFGMHDSDWTSAPAVPVGSANFTTSGTYWPSIETTPGVFNWAKLDEQVEAAEAAHAQPMIVLGQSPRFASSKPGSADYLAYMPNLQMWKHYVAQVADRYGARLDYQIWPEPNITQNWQGNPRQMAKLTAVAAKAINHHAGKKAKIISPAVALRLRGQRNWMVHYFKQKVSGKRVHRYVDAIAIDPFPAQRGTPEQSFKLMRTARKQLGHIGVHKPIWNNEINYGVAGGHETTHTTYPMGKQQSYVIRTYALSAAARMQRTYWLGWFDSHELGISMVGSDGEPLPTATSYQVVRSWLNRTNFLGCHKQRRGVWMCAARKGHKEVRRIYWKPRGKAIVRTPRGTKRVENQNGHVITHRSHKKVRLNLRPVMVASRK